MLVSDRLVFCLSRFWRLYVTGTRCFTGRVSSLDNLSDAFAAYGSHCVRLS